MSKTFTYTFTNGNTLTVTTADTAQPVDTATTGNPYSGFPITNVSGTYNGQTVTGLYGTSGAYQFSGGGGHDNAIFVDSTQGRGGSSYVGIDQAGIAFTLQNGNHVILSENNPSLLQSQTFNAQGNPVDNRGTVSLSETNYDTQVTACYTTNTRIRVWCDGTTADLPVENLRVGDLAVTAFGAHRPIRWIGHRDLDGAGKPLAHDQQPIRIRADAFGPGLPARDLRLSPGHPVLVGADVDNAGGHLVPIMCLINGTTIARDTAATAVTYWHVELDAHDILLAEGLPAESYLDWGDRPFFDEGSDHALHNPDFVVPGLSARCRPVAVDGPVVEAERVRLDAMFSTELAKQSAWNDPDLWLPA